MTHLHAKVHYRVYKSPPVVPNLNQMNSVRALIHYLFKIILILSFRLFQVVSSPLLPPTQMWIRTSVFHRNQLNSIS